MGDLSSKRRSDKSTTGSFKRLCIEDSSRPNDEVLQLTSEREDDNVDVCYSDNQFSAFSDDEYEHGLDTPTTPFSPVPKRFPSELKTIKCTYEGCFKFFNRPAKLASHLRSHTNERPFQCQYDGCDKSYIEDKHLKQHVKGSHTHEKSYKCDWVGCEKSFLTATRLKKHKGSHEDPNRFRCTEFQPCNQTFRKHQTLQRHIRSEHLELAPFPCTYLNLTTQQMCQAGFDAAGGLRRHEEKVHGELRYFCTACTSQVGMDGEPLRIGFTTKGLLEAHTRKSHINCPFCNEKSAGQRQLQKHIESQHSGTTLQQRKNIACTYLGCEKTFTKKYNLKVHIRTVHDGERFICGSFDLSKTPDLSAWQNENSCGKDFVSKANLEDHVRTAHLGLQSQINANRKRNVAQSRSYNSDAQRSSAYKPSAIDELLGDSYEADPRRNIACSVATCKHKFIRKYDMFLHVRSKHQISSPGLGEFITTALPRDASVVPARDLSSLITEFQHSEDYQDLDTTHDNIDIDWEIEQRAIEGGPFWFGSDNGMV